MYMHILNIFIDTIYCAINFAVLSTRQQAKANMAECRAASSNETSFTDIKQARL